MAVINTVKQFVDSRGITVYQFRKETGIAQATAYRLYNNSHEIPRGDVLSAICQTYRIQPGELLRWVADDSVDSKHDYQVEPPKRDHSLTTGDTR